MYASVKLRLNAKKDDPYLLFACTWNSSSVGIYRWRVSELQVQLTDLGGGLRLCISVETLIYTPHFYLTFFF